MDRDRVRVRVRVRVTTSVRVRVRVRVMDYYRITAMGTSQVRTSRGWWRTKGRAYEGQGGRLAAGTSGGPGHKWHPSGSVMLLSCTPG